MADYTNKFLNGVGLSTVNDVINTRLEKQAETFAKKNDIVGVYKYIGSVATVDQLPSSDVVAGSVYNVESTDMNYAWTGTAWDPLGSSFSIQTLTASEIRTIMGESAT